MARQAGAGPRIGDSEREQKEGAGRTWAEPSDFTLTTKGNQPFKLWAPPAPLSRGPPSFAVLFLGYQQLCSLPLHPGSLKAGSISTLFSSALWVQPPSQCEPFLLIWLMSPPLKSIPPASMQLSVSLNEFLLQSRQLISVSSEVKRWSSLIGN